MKVRLRCVSPYPGAKKLIVLVGGVLAGFEITDLTLAGNLRPVTDSVSETLWFDYQGDLITYDDDDTRAAKSKWGVSLLLSFVMR